MINLKPLLRGLDKKSQDAIVMAFNDLEKRLGVVESKKVLSVNEMKTLSRDMAKNETHYNGAQSLGTWHIKDLIRVDGMSKRKSIDLVIHASGELVINNDSEVIIGD